MDRTDDAELLAKMVQEKARDLNLCDAPFKLLRLGTNAVFGCTDNRVVARVPHIKVRSLEWLSEHLHIVHALVRQGAPLLAPICEVQTLPDGQTVTFWPMGTASPSMTPEALTDLLGRCHALTPSIPIERWNPEPSYLGRWRERLPRMQTLRVPTHIQEDLGERLATQVDALTERWAAARNACHPEVFIHGDPYPGNVVRMESGELKLIDLDFIAVGPSEVDLAGVLHHYTRHHTTPFVHHRVMSRCEVVVDQPLLQLICNANETITCAWLACLWGVTPGAAEEVQRRMLTLDDPDVPWLDF